jgi:hypothetical protein
MCMMILKPKGVRIPDGMLEKASILNPNGCGIAYCSDTGLILVKEPPLVSVQERTELWHLRYALSGIGDVQSTQPFSYYNGEFAFAHVGVLKDWGALGRHSDSWQFWTECRDFVTEARSRTGYQRLLSAYCSVTQNRMVLLSRWDRYWIFGESNGFWENGLWLSGVLE